MSAIPPADCVELSPAIRSILETNGLQSQFMKHYLRYLPALLATDTAGPDTR